MADTKLSALPSGSAIADADLFYSDQSATSVKQPASALATYMSGSKGFLNAGWFNVKNYGATGNGVTDDTTSINSAIAAFNSAGAGVLYFPVGTYLCSSGALTTITANGQVRGDGVATNLANVTSGAATVIKSPSATALLFQTSSLSLSFYSMTLVCTAATPSASIAITQLSSVAGNHQMNLYDVVVSGFWTGVDWQEASITSAERCDFNNCVQYGCRMRNITTPDAGGNRFLDCTWGNTTRSGVAGLRWESSGNLGIIGCTVYGGTAPNILTTGLDIHGSGLTTIVFIDGCSLENYLTNALSILQVNLVNIVNVEIGAYQQSGSQSPIQINSCSSVNIANIGAIKPSAPSVSIIDFNGGSCTNITMVNIANTGSNISGPYVISSVSALQNITGALLPLSGVTDVATIRLFTASPVGCRYMVNNTSQASPTLGQAVVAGDAGGTNIQPVFCDGTVWRYG